MYSENIQGLLDRNPIGFLVNYASKNPDVFKSDVLKVNEFGDSFFVTFLKQNYTDDFYLSLYDLATEYGYDIKKPVRQLTSSDIKLNLDIKDYLPEFLNILTFCRSDNLIAELAIKLGKEYFLELEKDGWFILETLYSRALPKTIQIVSDYGLDYENLPSKRSLLSIAERSPSLTDLYWENLNKQTSKNNDDGSFDKNQFLHFFNIIEKKCAQIHSKNDYYVNEVVSQIEEKFPKLSDEQREKLLEATVLSKDLSPLKKICKLMGIKSTDKLVQIATLKNPTGIQNKELLYSIINNPGIFVSEIDRVKSTANGKEEVVELGLDLFIKCLRSFSFAPFDKFGSSRTAVASVNLREKIYKSFNYETILTTKTNDGKNIFDLIVDRSHKTRVGNNLMFGLLNVGFNNHNKNGLIFDSIKNIDIENFKNNIITGLNEKQSSEVNLFLDRTWRTNGGISKSMTGNVVTSMLNERFFILDPIVLKSGDIFTREEKVHIFSEVISSMAESNWLLRIFDNREKYSSCPKHNEPFQEIVFKTLYQDIIANPDKSILNINISSDAIEKLAKTEFYSELQALMLKETLNSGLSKNNESSKKLKI